MSPICYEENSCIFAVHDVIAEMKACNSDDENDFRRLSSLCSSLFGFTTVQRYNHTTHACKSANMYKICTEK